MPKAKEVQSPLKQFNRLANGLIEDIKYVFKDDGKIDWRAMIDPKYIVVNNQYKDKVVQESGKKIDELDVTEVEDKYLLILLGGLKELLDLRGYRELVYKTDFCSPDFVSKTCRITFLPNFETNHQEAIFEDAADASPLNTYSWYAKYLTTAATNRAFARAIRNFLKIHIVSYEEIGPGDSSPEKSEFNPAEPHGVLKNFLDDKNRSFEKMKGWWVSLGHEEAKEWQTLSDVPIQEVFLILKELKKGK